MDYIVVKEKQTSKLCWRARALSRSLFLFRYLQGEFDFLVEIKGTDCVLNDDFEFVLRQQNLFVLFPISGPSIA